MPTTINPAPTAHLGQPEHMGLGGMRDLYANLRVYATSTHGDIMLIRSYLAYWQGFSVAERAEIRPSRGHSYRVKTVGREYIARISDHYDHRDGVKLFEVA